MKNFKVFFCLLFFFCHELHAKETRTFSQYKKSQKKASNLIKKEEIKSTSSNSDNIKIYQHALTVSIDKLNGKADEIVYEGNKKLSHLEWDIKNLKMLSLGFTSKIPDLFEGKSDLFETRIKFSNAINGGNGGMVNYDWIGTNYDGNKNHENWTHRSFSDVKIQKAQQFDIAGSFNLHKEEFRFNFGYKYDRFKWRDYGGSYIYSSLNEDKTESIAFRDKVGNFNGERGITYEQIFKTPYIGFEYQKELFDKEIYANIFGNYSNLVTAEDEDMHHLRNIKFNEYFKNGKYYNWGFNILGKIKEDLYLGAGYEFVYYPENRGYTIVKDLDTNESDRYDDSAGIRNKFSKISLNLKYNFTTTSNL
jgi:plasminogen activator